MHIPWKAVHFTGIGGVGMTGLALILLDLGVEVNGTDIVESKNLAILRERGAHICIGHNSAHLQTPDILVYSSAVATDNPERLAAERHNLPQLRRGEFLSLLARRFPQCVSCAGTHGKTTTSAMLTHILRNNGLEPGYLIGGDVVTLPCPAAAGKKELLVTEVDESDGTQATMHSSHAIITNIEDDHCWSVGGVDALYDCFRTLASQAGAVVCWETENTRSILGRLTNVEFLNQDGIPESMSLRLPGLHNRINATLAVRMAQLLGVSIGDAITAINSFAGVERRQSVRYNDNDVVVIEDYAHHPTEVRATIQAVRERCPQACIKAVFQPHRYERIARYRDDFCRALEEADEVLVTPAFAAWKDDEQLADPRSIATGIRTIPARYIDSDYPMLARDLAAFARSGDVFVIMGAGTITEFVKPLVDALCRRRIGSIVEPENP